MNLHISTVFLFNLFFGTITLVLRVFGKVVDKVITYIPVRSHFHKYYYKFRYFIFEFIVQSLFVFGSRNIYLLFGTRNFPNLHHYFQKHIFNWFYFYFVWMIIRSLDFFGRTSISLKHMIYLAFIMAIVLSYQNNHFLLFCHYHYV